MALCTLSGCKCENSTISADSLLDFVDPLIGTGGHGHTFPGAAYPFGMVQLSPDTGLEGWDWCSGYHYSDSSIIGFSHTHLSGTGRSDLMDVMLMPVTGNLKLSPGSKSKPDEGYRSRLVAVSIVIHFLKVNLLILYWIYHIILRLILCFLLL